MSDKEFMHSMYGVVEENTQLNESIQQQRNMLKEKIGEVKPKKATETIEVDDGFYAAMYNSEEQAPPAKASKVLGGLKLSGSHVQKLVLGEQQIDIPSVAYVKVLEDQIRELRRELREAQSKLRSTINQQAKLIEHMNRLKIDLDNKVDMKF